MGTGVDLYVPSLPAITNYYHTSAHIIQLTISFYILGYGIGQLLLGILSDSIGRRKTLIVSALLYTIVSFLCIYAPNPYSLNALRFLQGIFIAGLGVSVRSIAVDCFSGLDLTKAMTYISISWSLGPIIGPFMGSYIQHYFDWQANFIYFGIYGLSIFIYAAITLPETIKEQHPLVFTNILSTIVNILKNKSFVLGSIIASLFYAVIASFNIVGPFLIQVTMHYSVITYGHIALLLGAGYFLGNVSNRFLINYINPIRLAGVAIIAALFVAIILFILGLIAPMNIYIIVIPVILIFYLLGHAFPNIVADIISFCPIKAGSVNALQGSIMAGGVFIFTTIAASLKATSQIPLATLYVVLLTCSLVLFLNTIGFKQNVNH
ncbi:MAG: multidrug effflux MFS transporter [Gammaproteobacteria bacterium]|nr:multidrug effflux MFS transporter [Gammaproteobacteria bacterium]